MSKLFVAAVAVVLASAVVLAAGGVQEMNGQEEYDRVTGQEGKVVFTMVHASWCGHCQSLAPEYVEVAKHFEDNDKVVVTKYDAPANEDHARNVLQIKSFPTLFLYKSGKKTDYAGARNKAGIIAAIEDAVKDV